jgi:hypothetical protein
MAAQVQNLKEKSMPYQQQHLRLWIQPNDSWVRITLERDEWLELPTTGGPTDEGYSYTERRYRWNTDNGTVQVESHTQCSDCDGPMEFFNSGWCEAHKIANEERELPCSWVTGESEWVLKQQRWEREARPVWAPYQWHKGKSSQRDYSAEAMNY